MGSMLFDIGVVVATATLFGLVARLLKQPPILGYILAGFALSTVLVEPATIDVLDLFSNLGVAFLLFLLGIELNITELHEVGLVSLMTGIGQVLVTSVMGFMIAVYLFGFGAVEASYIAMALTFSSTIIIIKLLGEKGDLTSLYGRIAVGMLIVQDMVAIVALIALASLSQISATANQSFFVELFEVLATGVLLVALIFILGRILRVLLQFLTHSTELLLLGTVSWAIFVPILTHNLGFSLEVGAFLAGIVLATSPYSIEIAAKMKPFRDFFIVMFFVMLGMSLTVAGFQQNLVQILVLSASVLIGNPLILLTIMGVMGYHRRISFLTGLTVSQISEFSLILVSTGVVLGQVRNETLAVVTGVGIVTLVGSTYLINHGDTLYRLFSNQLKIFERKGLRKNHTRLKAKYDVLLIGAHQMGQVILKNCLEHQVKVLVVDFDPVLVKKLRQEKINAVYGDVSDGELINELDLTNIKVIISTVPVLEDSLFMLSRLCDFFRDKVDDLLIIARAKNQEESEILKRNHVDYTLVPELVSGEKVVQILSRSKIIQGTNKK